MTRRSFPPLATKIITRERLGVWRSTRRGQVVFTNGVFDLLHPGHVDLLRYAASLGGSLVVGVNTDASVRRLNKGPERPIRSQDERAQVLAALEGVDVVTLFDEDTPRELIAALQPDILVKGGDYTVDAVVGRDIVEARGGRVVLVPLTPGQSTTRIVRDLRASDSHHTQA